MWQDIITEFKFNLNKLSYEPSKLRHFSFILAAAWLVIYWVKLGLVIGPNFVIPPLILVSLGWFVPQWLRPIFGLWMIISFALGAAVSRLVLIVLFFVVLWPIQLVAKLFGVRFIDRSFKLPQASYWQEGNDHQSSLEQPF